ncbi:MAG TPA: type II toxin-antitoxin system RelE/ParE family toxin [Longimicrobium sp.]|nr:type II toxin-antitoxin system RelE/ParE family toxin [Longimicrobium sp.]
MSEALEILPSSWYRLELAALPKDQQERINRKLMALAAKGWSAAVADQTVEHLQDGIHALRVVGHGPAFRPLFFVVPGRRPRVIVLTTCPAKSLTKKRQRLEAEIERAKKRREAWIEEHTKKEEEEEESDGG